MAGVDDLLRRASAAIVKARRLSNQCLRELSAHAASHLFFCRVAEQAGRPPGPGRAPGRAPATRPGASAAEQFDLWCLSRAEAGPPPGGRGNRRRDVHAGAARAVPLCRLGGQCCGGGNTRVASGEVVWCWDLAPGTSCSALAIFGGYRTYHAAGAEPDAPASPSGAAIALAPCEHVVPLALWHPRPCHNADPELRDSSPTSAHSSGPFEIPSAALRLSQNPEAPQSALVADQGTGQLPTSLQAPAWGTATQVVRGNSPDDASVSPALAQVIILVAIGLCNKSCY